MNPVFFVYIKMSLHDCMYLSPVVVVDVIWPLWNGEYICSRPLLTWWQCKINSKRGGANRFYLVNKYPLLPFFACSSFTPPTLPLPIPSFSYCSYAWPPHWCWPSSYLIDDESFSLSSKCSSSCHIQIYIYSTAGVIKHQQHLASLDFQTFFLIEMALIFSWQLQLILIQTFSLFKLPVYLISPRIYLLHQSVIRKMLCRTDRADHINILILRIMISCHVSVHN